MINTILMSSVLEGFMYWAANGAVFIGITWGGLAILNWWGKRYERRANEAMKQWLADAEMRRGLR